MLAATFIYIRLSNNTNLDNFIKLIQDLDITRVWLILFLIFLLMFLNWFIESIKWKFLISKVEPISTKRAIESVFCGLTWAVFTPNRIGEYGGRIFFLSPRKRIQGMVAMSVGHIAQMVLTNVIGALAMLWFIYRFLEMDSILFYAISFLVFSFSFFFILFYFNIHWLNNLILNIKILKNFKIFFKVLTRYKKKELGKVMLYSISRFLVFTSQYLLIMGLLIPNVSAYESAFLVFILFFVQSALPSLDLLDIGVRSMTAAYFFSFITSQEIAVMAAAALIWLVNLIIPAILGSFFVFKLKFFSDNY